MRREERSGDIALIDGILQALPPRSSLQDCAGGWTQLLRALLQFDRSVTFQHDLKTS